MNSYLIVAIEKFSTLGINFLSLIIMSRYLSPTDFGVMAIIQLVISLSNILVDSGMGGALIYEKKITNKDYNTVFTVNVIIAMCMLFLISIFSSSIEGLYDIDGLGYLLIAAASTILIKSFSLTSMVELTKNMKFTIQIFVNLISNLLGLIVAVLFVINEYGVWSLVYQQITISILFSMGMLLSSTIKPRFRLDPTSFKKHFSFGYKLTISSLINNGYQTSLPAILGLKNPISDVGNFSQATRLNNIYYSLFYSVIDKVAFPKLSRKKSADSFNNEAVKIIIYSMLSIVTLVFFVFIFSDNIVLLLLGDKWAHIAIILAYICFSAPFLMYESLIRIILKSSGEAGVILKYEIIKKSISVVILIASASYGLDLFLIAFIACSFLNCCVNIFLCHMFTSLNLRKQFKALKSTLLLALVYILVYFALI